MIYKSVIVNKTGSPEVLQIVENDLRAPPKGKARIKVLAAAVCRPDITVRRGEALYSGTLVLVSPEMLSPTERVSVYI